jgi:phosphoserine aminotransferase
VRLFAGMSVMEMSHRGKEFIGIAAKVGLGR